MKIIKIAPSFNGTNSYILYNESFMQGVVIDPDDYDTVVSTAKKHGVEIVACLLTHGHFDHIGGVCRLQKDGVKVYISNGDKEMLSTDQNLGYLFGVSVDKCYPDFTFNDGDTLDIAGVKLFVMVTPGHTKGSACFVTENAIFTGDTLFYLSIGRTDLGGDERQMAESLNRLKNLDGEWVLYCGHGRATTLDYEKKYNPYL